MNEFTFVADAQSQNGMWHGTVKLGGIIIFNYDIGYYPRISYNEAVEFTKREFGYVVADSLIPPEYGMGRFGGL